MTTPIRPLSVKLDPELRARMQKLASARQRSMHWMMCDAIRCYVDNEEKREHMRLDTLRNWEEYEANGLHITASEAKQWISSWFTENELPSPKCHK